MRVKRQKRQRRAVRFFTTCFGFRQPFKVLCDGTFIHHLLIHDIAPADKALADVLGGTTKLFTTSCVIGELEHLSLETHKKNRKKIGSQDAADQNSSAIGNPYFESFKAARKLAVARCDHEKRIGAEACIMEVIGDENPYHFFVATQDADMRKNLQQKPAVPLLFGLHKALLLEPPSAFQKEFAAASEEKRLHMTKLEHKLLKKRMDKDLVAGRLNDGDSSDKEATEISPASENLEKHSLRQHGKQKVDHGRKGLGVSDKPKFKRKKAKAPNPLSCKKKKTRAHEDGAKAKVDKDHSETLRSRSRNRIRKRLRKGKTAAETDS
uniref:UTP23 sensor motif region domain-containing protein n=1 Tax=Kalanchoe fedtschenkoi TaxID=63787 RepID=A0A7N0T0W8_KALFE